MLEVELAFEVLFGKITFTFVLVEDVIRETKKKKKYKLLFKGLKISFLHELRGAI